jgi:hypothetical protein
MTSRDFDLQSEIGKITKNHPKGLSSSGERFGVMILEIGERGGFSF